MRLGPGDLLEHDPRYGVLICRECQYAIQKSALQSHLLKHKIYRDERQRLLSVIAQLNILEPHDVPLPTSTPLPIDALPIISGYICTADGCSNLCASSKRMRRHWSDIHGRSESLESLRQPAIMRSVKLQTFFRGSKIRYFVVAYSAPVDSSRASSPSDITVDEAGADDDEEMHDEKPETLPLPDSRPQVPQNLSSSPSLVKLDMTMFRYFHHFTTTTSLTLPDVDCLPDSTPFWQQNVVLQALGREWMMCGLLCISALHLAVLETNQMMAQVHRKQSSKLLAQFFAGWKEGTDPRFIAPDTEDQAEMLKTGERIRCLLYCAAWASADVLHDRESIEMEAGQSELQCFLTAIRGIVPPTSVSSAKRKDDDLQAEAFVQAQRIFQTRRSSDPAVSERTPPEIVNSLRDLPSLMAEAFGKPESAQAFMATVSAIAALIQCCEESFSSNDPLVTWQAMEMWLTKAPEYFNQMAARNHPAALVVIAHWACLLVQRAEQTGHWYLRGSAKKILSLVNEGLPAVEHLVHGLIEGFMA